MAQSSIDPFKVCVVELAQDKGWIGQALRKIPDWIIREAGRCAQQELRWQREHRDPSRLPCPNPWPFITNLPEASPLLKKICRAAQSQAVAFRQICRLATGVATANTDWQQQALDARAKGDERRADHAANKVASALYQFRPAEKIHKEWLHGPPAAGRFGCWKGGFKENWCEKLRREFTDSEWRIIRENWKRAEAERERAEQERRAKARKVAARILNSAAPTESHPYLSAKGVQAHGELRRRGDLLVLPLRDQAGELHGLQFIARDKRFDGERDKTFLSGSRISGCFFTLSDKPDGPLAICEGYATGASVHEATGFATVAAMDCGNLKAVAEALRAKWPQRDIILAADNDAFTTDRNGKPWNPGVEKASDAANGVGAKLAVPKFKNSASKSSSPSPIACLNQSASTLTIAAYKASKSLLALFRSHLILLLTVRAFYRTALLF